MCIYPSASTFETMATKDSELSPEKDSAAIATVTWNVSDADLGVVPQSSSFSITNLPDINSHSAPTAAATKLRLLLKYMESGESRPVSRAEIHNMISYSADVLNHCSIPGAIEEKRSKGFEELSAVTDTEVRGWLSSTFTKPSASQKPKKRQSFRSVATSIMFSKFMESLYKGHKDTTSSSGLECSPAIENILHKLDSWDFPIFEAERLTTHQPLRYIGLELFKRHNLISIYKIPPASLDAFLVAVETGYKTNQNSYHNETHGADVLQTVHSLVVSTEFHRFWLGSLELLALLLAAIIHDVDHPGTTNAFHIKTKSEYAMLYNDHAVLENHHLTYSFKLLMNEEMNVLQGLNTEDYFRLRSLVIDMVLATDMSCHFDHLNEMQSLLSASNAVLKLTEEHRSKVLCLLLHSADVSNPTKSWDVHTQWTSRILEEFFQQGDKEKQLSLPPSPLCDRNNTSVPGSQLGFIQHIVRPIWDVCGDMLEVLTSSATSSSSRPWLKHLTYNWEQWTLKLEHKQPTNTL